MLRRRGGSARGFVGRGRWRSAPPLDPSSGHMLSSCRARIESRGSRGRGRPAAAGSLRTRTAAFVGTLECDKFLVSM